MRGRAAERVLGAVDVHAARSESRCGSRRCRARVRAHDDIRVLEHARLEHLRLRRRRHHLLTGRAVHDDAARQVILGEVFRHRDPGGHPDRSLRGVLVAVERALGAAQRVVFEDHAEVRRTVVLLVACDERGLQTADAHLDVEIVRPEIVGELLDRFVLDESDLGMPGEVVAQREQLLVHELFRARRDLIARRVRDGEFRDPAGHVERLLERRHFPEDVFRRLALRGSVLCRERRRGGERKQSKESERAHRKSGRRVSRNLPAVMYH